MIYSMYATSFAVTQSAWSLYCVFVNGFKPSVFASFSALDRSEDKISGGRMDLSVGNVSANCAEAKIPV